MAEQREWIGQMVGEYRLLRKLGGGSFGQVYLAEHIRDHNQVALKLLQVTSRRKKTCEPFSTKRAPCVCVIPISCLCWTLD